MQIHLGLGSNLGDRRANLREAITGLKALGIDVEQVSPVVHSPALLPSDAVSDWNRPYLNLAVRAATELDPQTLLQRTKQLEASLGREPGERWAPRIIDIDILLYGSERINLPDLQIPHPGIAARNFVLTPLIALNPSLQLSTATGRRNSVLDLSRGLDLHIPLWMGIVNITPDSFSDGGLWQRWDQTRAHIAQMVEAGVNFVDLGAESTRPGAEPLDADAEWARLSAVLEPLLDEYKDDPLRPKISVDTYHANVARRALAAGADVINDVSGLESAAMLELAAEGNGEWIAMHQLALPVDPTTTFTDGDDAVARVHQWIEKRKLSWQRFGIDLNRIYIDPGIGFGKTPLQSLQLLRSASTFRDHGLRTLIGHSRKSFMRSFAAADPRTRDLATIGMSLSLIEQKVDVIRVHNVADHVIAYRGWSHLCAV